MTKQFDIFLMKFKQGHCQKQTYSVQIFWKKKKKKSLFILVVRVRIFESRPRKFNIAATIHMQIHNDPAFQLAHLPSYAILTLLTNKPHSINNLGFDISQGDIELY